jgi:predicted nucleic acid-binding protein
VAIPLTPDAAMTWIRHFRDFPCVSVTAELVEMGISISVKHRISYWDAAVVAATEALGATTLYTEDLNHGQQIGSVRIINPFRQKPS